MTFFRLGDEFADDPAWLLFAEDAAARKAVRSLSRTNPAWLVAAALQAAYARLGTVASHIRSNGYLREEQALTACLGADELLALLTRPAFDRPPLLHRQDDKCACLGDTWIPGYAYRIHDFLRRNPSSAEVDRNKAQKADLRDYRLREQVYNRDGRCCRYCRSGPLEKYSARARDRRKVLQFDHVDPDQPAGPDGVNLVVACGSCNEYKGHRTPDEADMMLLPVPTDDEKAAWEQRGLELFTRPELGEHPRPIHNRTSTEPQHDPQHVVDPVVDPLRFPLGIGDGDPIDNTTGSVRPRNADHDPQPAATQHGKAPGQGRGGQPVDEQSRQPARDPAYPDIWHRRSRPGGAS